MRSSVSKRGQTAIPAELRKKYDLGQDTKLEWLDYRGLIVALPVKGDPIRAAKGLTKGEGLHARLLDLRQQERARERKVTQKSTGRKRAS